MIQPWTSVCRLVLLLVLATPPIAQGQNQHQIDTLKNEQENWIRTSLAILIFISVVLVFGIRRYRYNQKKTQDLVHQIEELTDAHLIQIEDTEERIRLEIGRELHDDLSASIAASCRYLRMKQINESNEVERDLIERITNMLEESYNLARGRSHEIIFGEVQAKFWERLTDQVNLFFAGTSMHIDLTIESEGLKLSADQKSTLLYCLKEGITNIIKHAKATEVQILLYQDPGWIILKIMDNGKGISSKAVKLGVGLKSLSDRIGKLGGKIRVDCAKSGGTQLEVALPSESILLNQS